MSGSSELEVRRTQRRGEASELFAHLTRGGKKNPFWFVGPCVVEERGILSEIARELKRISEKHAIPVVFKASFDKANRTSHESFRGVGFERGLEELLWVKREFKLPVITDVHETRHVEEVAEVVDILQIPAFLCRQTDLLEAAAKTGRPVNVKKGQFVAPANVPSIISKLKHYGASRVWLTERGVSFGYQRLVVDFAAFPELERAGAPLILDVTHSVQLPGGGEGNKVTGGIREAIPVLARAGAAAGVSGFFAETHPEPARALSDSTNAWKLADLENLMLTAKKIAEVSGG